MLPRILSGLVGLLMLITGLGWITDPASAAANLGMPLLDDLGRSTQIGDFTAFFIAVAGFSLYGAWKRARTGYVVPRSCYCWQLFSERYRGLCMAPRLRPRKLLQRWFSLGCCYSRHHAGLARPASSWPFAHITPIRGSDGRRDYPCWAGTSTTNPSIASVRRI